MKIESIKIKHVLDDCPDTSWLGEFTDDLEPGVIVRDYGEFYEKLPAEMERDLDGRFLCKGEPEVPERGREYRGFIPADNGENQGTKNFYKYAMQDFKRMEGLNRCDWYFIGIMAEAVVSYPINGGGRRLETLSSGGLWGIESDSGDYLKEVEQQELNDLKDHLKQFGVDVSHFDKINIDGPYALVEQVNFKSFNGGG